jgi:hypothetical protein
LDPKRLVSAANRFFNPPSFFAFGEERFGACLKVPTYGLARLFFGKRELLGEVGMLGSEQNIEGDWNAPTYGLHRCSRCNCRRLSKLADAFTMRGRTVGAGGGFALEEGWHRYADASRAQPAWSLVALLGSRSSRMIPDIDSFLSMLSKLKRQLDAEVKILSSGWALLAIFREPHAHPVAELPRGRPRSICAVGWEPS